MLRIDALPLLGTRIGTQLIDAAASVQSVKGELEVNSASACCYERLVHGTATVVPAGVFLDRGRRHGGLHPGLCHFPQLIAPDHPDILRLVTATRNALARLHASRELAVQAIRDIEQDISPEDVVLLYDRYIQPYWTHDGRPDRQIAERSLEELARELGVERAPAYSDLYKIP